MTVTPLRPTSTTSPASRLRLDPNPSHRTVLDGAWWPRSTAAAVELPALLDAVGDARGEVTHAILNSADWDLPHPRRVPAGGRRLRLGWFTAQPSGLITLICDFGRNRFDLLVVPPDAAEADAEAALRAAADPADGRKVPELLAGIMHQA